MTEAERLAATGSFDDGLAGANPWYRWGPYLAERAWGTVREDYGAECSGWRGVSHDQARSKAYRWNEEGLAGICDDRQRLCLALALWNGVDPILKERMYGLTNDEGNHGEDAKEYWWYRDALPSSAYLAWRYHYPQREFPYDWLREEAARRRAGGPAPEPELLDSGVFDGDRYWVVDVTYAKSDVDDVRLRVEVTNAGPEPATLHLLPTLWFRNTWSWAGFSARPGITRDGDALVTTHPELPAYRLTASTVDGVEPDALFCDNDSNLRRLYGTADGPAFPKDGINDHVVHGAATVNPAGHGTKAAWWYRLTVEPGQTATVHLRLSTPDGRPGPDDVFAARAAEADEFYAALTPAGTGAAEAMVLRQAYASLLWSRQYYPYDVAAWLDGDPGQPPPPPVRRQQPPGRNTRWRHLRADDVFCMPDTWEYPWFASWDLAFHSVVLARLDPAFAKYQLRLLCLDRYQHPEGDLPAYEWEFSDLNPPVHAWAALSVYRRDGGRDRQFLVDIFTALRRNFAWWLAAEDRERDSLFTGGFLGLDNVGPFNRSAPPDGVTVEQADATAWMAFYALSMLCIAGELDDRDAVAEYLEHVATIGQALSDLGLWDPDDGFFFDRVHFPDGRIAEVKVHSIVGVVPLFATAVLPLELVAELPAGFADPDRPGFVTEDPARGRALLTVGRLDHIATILAEVLDEQGFLSPYGIRSLSRRSPDGPAVEGTGWAVAYRPGEADEPSVNSNWRGPVWFPVNFLLYEALVHIGQFEGADLRVELPTGSGDRQTLDRVGEALRQRLVALFLPGPDGRRPSYGWVDRFWHDPRWRENILFFEYFHGDNGAGLGAAHQTGWTALVAELIARGRRTVAG